MYDETKMFGRKPEKVTYMHVLMSESGLGEPELNIDEEAAEKSWDVLADRFDYFWNQWQEAARKAPPELTRAAIDEVMTNPEPYPTNR